MDYLPDLHPSQRHELQLMCAVEGGEALAVPTVIRYFENPGCNPFS